MSKGRERFGQEVPQLRLKLGMYAKRELEAGRHVGGVWSWGSLQR